jgi:hypothetical protein
VQTRHGRRSREGAPRDPATLPDNPHTRGHNDLHRSARRRTVPRFSNALRHPHLRRRPRSALTEIDVCTTPGGIAGTATDGQKLPVRVWSENDRAGRDAVSDISHAQLDQRGTRSRLELLPNAAMKAATGTRVRPPACRHLADAAPRSVWPISCCATTRTGRNGAAARSPRDASTLSGGS